MRRFAFATLLLPICLGCATSAPDTSQFAQVDEFVVDAPYAEAWQSCKEVLQDLEYLIYTRDTQGIFVSFRDQERRFLTPYRTQLTINLTELTPDSTQIIVETLDQAYGVRLLTYPNWHARPTSESPETTAVIDGIHAHLAGEYVPQDPDPDEISEEAD